MIKMHGSREVTSAITSASSAPAAHKHYCDSSPIAGDDSLFFLSLQETGAEFCAPGVQHELQQACYTVATRKGEGLIVGMGGGGGVCRRGRRPPGLG